MEKVRIRRTTRKNDGSTLLSVKLPCGATVTANIEGAGAFISVPESVGFGWGPDVKRSKRELPQDECGAGRVHHITSPTIYCLRDNIPALRALLDAFDAEIPRQYPKYVRITGRD